MCVCNLFLYGCRCACPVGQKSSGDALACVEGSPPVRTNHSLVPPVERFPPAASVTTAQPGVKSASASGDSSPLRDQFAAPAPGAGAAGGGAGTRLTSDESAMSPRTAVFVLVALLVAIVVLASLIAMLTFFNYWRRSNRARGRLALVGSLRGVQSISFGCATPVDLNSATPMAPLVKETVSETGEPRDEDADAESSTDSGASDNGATATGGIAETMPLKSATKVTFAAAAPSADHSYSSTALASSSAASSSATASSRPTEPSSSYAYRSVNNNSA